MKKLYKIYCSACKYTHPLSNERTKKCYECGSSLLKELESTTDDFISFVTLELENANHHGYVEFPGKLFGKIVEEIVLSQEAKLILAKVIAEEFYKNI